MLSSLTLVFSASSGINFSEFSEIALKSGSEIFSKEFSWAVSSG